MDKNCIKKELQKGNVNYLGVRLLLIIILTMFSIAAFLCHY